MLRLILIQVAAGIALGFLAEARIQTPGSVTTGPFSHGAAVAYEKMRLKKSVAQPQPQRDAEKAKAETASPKEKQPLRKRLFGRKSGEN